MTTVVKMIMGIPLRMISITRTLLHTTTAHTIHIAHTTVAPTIVHIIAHTVLKISTMRHPTTPSTLHTHTPLMTMSTAHTTSMRHLHTTIHLPITAPIHTTAHTPITSLHR